MSTIKHRLEHLEEKLAKSKPVQLSAEALEIREVEEVSIPDIDKHIRALEREIAEIESQMPPVRA
jgi:hypothetical protein